MREFKWETLTWERSIPVKGLYPHHHKRLQKLETYALRTSLKVHEGREDISSSVFLLILQKVVFCSNLSKKSTCAERKVVLEEKWWILIYPSSLMTPRYIWFLLNKYHRSVIIMWCHNHAHHEENFLEKPPTDLCIRNG